MQELEAARKAHEAAREAARVQREADRKRADEEAKERQQAHADMVRMNDEFMHTCPPAPGIWCGDSDYTWASGWYPAATELTILITKKTC